MAATYTDFMTRVSTAILPGVKAWFQEALQDKMEKQPSSSPIKYKLPSEEDLEIALGIAFDIGQDRILGKVETIDAIVKDLLDVMEHNSVTSEICTWRVESYSFNNTSCGKLVPADCSTNHTYCNHCGKLVFNKSIYED